MAPDRPEDDGSRPPTRGLRRFRADLLAALAATGVGVMVLASLAAVGAISPRGPALVLTACLLLHTLQVLQAPWLAAFFELVRGPTVVASRLVETMLLGLVVGLYAANESVLADAVLGIYVALEAGSLAILPTALRWAAGAKGESDRDDRGGQDAGSR